MGRNPDNEYCNVDHRAWAWSAMLQDNTTKALTL
jgi:hypothetical protein